MNDMDKTLVFLFVLVVLIVVVVSAFGAANPGATTQSSTFLSRSLGSGCGV